MEDLIKELENNINDYLVLKTPQSGEIIHNFLLFYHIAKETKEALEPFFKDEICLYHPTNATVLEKLEITKNYFNFIDVNFPLDKYIQDGTIAFIDYNQFHENFDFFNRNNCFKGNMTKENGKKIINACESGYISDIPILVHEISHFRDEPDKKRNEISNLLTEALAYTESYMVCDYLWNLGYKVDVENFIKYYFNALYQIASNFLKQVKLFLCFINMGNLNKKSYQEYFKLIDEEYNDYEEVIEFVKNEFVIKHKQYDICFETWYLLGLFLSPFLFQKYKTAENFNKTMKELHVSINELDFLGCLEKMGLNDLGAKDRKQIIDSFAYMKEHYFDLKNENRRK